MRDTPGDGRAGADRQGRNLAVGASLVFALAHLGWVTLHPRASALPWPGDALSLGVLYAAALACAQAARGGADQAAAWRWIALALGVRAVADTGFDLLNWRGGAVPTPPGLNALYLAFYPLFALGCLALPRQPLRRAEAWRITLDASIVVGALGTLLWYGVLAQTGAILVSTPARLASPLLDLGVLGLLLTVMRRGQRFRVQESLLAFGLTTFLTGNLLYLPLNARDASVSGPATDLLWTGGRCCSRWPPGVRAGPLRRSTR